MVDPLLSTSSAVQSYYTNTSGSVNVPPAIWTGNTSSIREEPVSIGNIRTNLCATITLVSNAKQGIITFTNVLQGNDTIVLVDCTIEWEPNIP